MCRTKYKNESYSFFKFWVLTFWNVSSEEKSKVALTEIF